ncbi:MAG: lytic transglycosylase domain-containing protein [Nitrospiraceae bacterium]
MPVSLNNNRHQRIFTAWGVSAVMRRMLCPLSVLLLVTLGWPAPTKSDFDGRSRYSNDEIQRAIVFYAHKYQLEPALLRAIIKAESDFQPDAVSSKGAVGLMQLMPDTAADLRVHDRFDAVQNIRGGARQLHYLLGVYDGDLRLAVAAYNAGVHRIRGHGHIARIRETRRYVRKVFRYYRIFKAEEQRQQRHFVEGLARAV